MSDPASVDPLLKKILETDPMSVRLHYKIASVASQFEPGSLLDMDGTGKLNMFYRNVTNANIRNGEDGARLSFEDNSFDVCTSIATLEHVLPEDQYSFLMESLRVSRRGAVHWFPMRETAYPLELLKKKYNHRHPCVLPPEDLFKGLPEHTIEPFITCAEHLMQLTPSMRNLEVYDYCNSHSEKHYEYILTIKSNMEV